MDRANVKRKMSVGKVLSLLPGKDDVNEELLGGGVLAGVGTGGTARFPQPGLLLAHRPIPQRVKFKSNNSGFIIVLHIPKHVLNSLLLLI